MHFQRFAPQANCIRLNYISIVYLSNSSLLLSISFISFNFVCSPWLCIEEAKLKSNSLSSCCAGLLLAFVYYVSRQPLRAKEPWYHLVSSGITDMCLKPSSLISVQKFGLCHFAPCGSISPLSLALHLKGQSKSGSMRRKARRPDVWILKIKF